ncbi:MAG: PilZ domain-containing protein [Desulfobulbaceae bacterium]|nr:PilZ domain-containing protein [Desulfobulbaceae bacterium]
MKAHERRVATRVPAQFKVNFIHEGDYLISHTRDISVDGLFLYTETPPAVHEQTELTFSIGDLHDVSLMAEVVWVNHGRSAKDSGMAVRFINPQEDLIAAILQLIHKVAVFPA